ncbi:MAG: acetylornithine transaminase [Deltaproteobacteria bacterium]|nr:acetylornithine transaminase [Deltaproteobacteria bacterium]
MADRNADLVARAKQVFTPNYAPAEIVLDRGEGVYLFDVEGRRYLDMVGGIAVSALGHNHPALIGAIEAQIHRVLHLSNLYYSRPALELAERLVASAFGDRIFFCNSGTEAIEASVKLARRYAYDRGETERTEIISFEHSFHGRTYGALAATAQPKYQEGFGAMLPGFTWLPVGDFAALEAAVSRKTAAVLIEPIQGEGGVNVPPSGFLAACRRATERAGALLIFDEIQTGIGRTGRLFAHEHEAVTPDLMALAKGLGGGLPIGAVVARADVGASLAVGRHGTTFGGNPVACAAGCAVMDHVNAPEFLAHVAQVGERLRAGLTEMAVSTGAFKDVRGRGLLVGAELSDDAPFSSADVVKRARGHGVLLHVAGPRVVRFVPPLVIDSAQVDEALAAVGATLSELVG